MKQNLYKRLEQLESIHAAALKKAAYRAAARSGVEVFGELMRKYGIEPLPGESQMDAFACAAGLSSGELRDLLWQRSQQAGP
jgi:hypothetical protein